MMPRLKNAIAQLRKIIAKGMPAAKLPKEA
jgi:hypothetical protein